jgi:hypothetical protein
MQGTKCRDREGLSPIAKGFQGVTPAPEIFWQLYAHFQAVTDHLTSFVIAVSSVNINFA